MNPFARVLPPLLLVLLLTGCKRPDSTPTPAHGVGSAAGEGYIDAEDGVRLFYRIIGTGRDTLVVIHGGPGFSMGYFAADLEPLAQNHTLLFYDQRGGGRSTLVSDSVALDAQRFADDLEALREHFGLERLTMLGHSWGAGVAALYAARYPERVGRFLIMGGIPARGKDLVEAFQQLAASRDSTTLRAMRAGREARLADPGDAAACRAYYALWFRPFYSDSATASRSKLDVCGDSPEALRNKMSSVDRFTMMSLGEWDWVPSLRAVMAPALVVHGTSDVFPVQSAREWAAALPNGRLLLLEEVGHFPYLEAAERFFGAVDEFLHGRWPEGAQIVTIP